MLNTSNDQRKLLPNFENLFATSGVARLRELILTLAVQGKLVVQDASDEPASALLKKIRAEKDRLMAEGKIKKDKPLAAITEEEKPFELPVGWEWIRVCDLNPEFQNGASSRGDIGGKLITVIRLADVKNKKINFDNVREIPISESDIEKYNINAGDILITRVNGSADIVGQFNICVDNVNAIYCDHFIRMRISNDIVLSEFLFLLGQSYLIRRRIKELFITTAGQKTVNQGHIGSLSFSLPPLAEQSRIVTRVEELMRLCDALEEKGRLEHSQHQQLLQAMLDSLTQTSDAAELARYWQRLAQNFDLLVDRPEAVDALEQTILQLAVRGLLVPQDPSDEPANELLKKIRAEKDRLIAEGKIKKDKPLPVIGEDEKPFELPVGWEWVRMGDFINSSEAGWSPSCHGHTRSQGKWGVLKVSAVSWGDFDSSANKELPEELAARPEYEVKDGDFLLSRANTAELVARSVVVKAPEPLLMLSDKLIRLNVSSQINKFFLNMVNNSNSSRQHYLANASGTSSSMKNVSREVVLNLPVAVPPLAEQSRIVARVTELRALCQQLREKLTQARTTQTQLAQAWVEQAAA